MVSGAWDGRLFVPSAGVWEFGRSGGGGYKQITPAGGVANLNQSATAMYNVASNGRATVSYSPGANTVNFDRGHGERCHDERRHRVYALLKFNRLVGILVGKKIAQKEREQV